jgi:protein transport protein HofC
LAAAADRIAALLREGMEPADLLQDEKLFPSEIRWAVGLGESRKDLAASLIQVGIMNRELERVFLSRLAMLIYAGIFLVIGFTIGFIVIALYWPIFNFGNLIY